MAHQIFGQRFYGNRKPAWHGLGITSETDQTAVEALSAIGGGYWFEKRPVTVVLNNKQVETGDWAIVRSPLPDDPEERVFGYTTDRYNLFQPLEAVELFDEKVGEPVETLGMLQRGERMFLTWKMPTFEAVKSDPIDLYGFLALGFDGIMGASLNVVSVRVVCSNTWAAAISEAENTNERGKGRIYSGKHTSKNMKYELGEWMGFVQQEAKQKVELTKSFFKTIAKVPLTEEKEVCRLLFSAYPDPIPLAKDAYIPDALRRGKEEKIEEKKELATKYRTGIVSLFFGQGTQITPNLYGLFNSTTEYFNYGQMEKKPANVSILMGTRADNMNKMAEVLAYEAAKK
jgi:hypothetical protein